MDGALEHVDAGRERGHADPATIQLTDQLEIAIVIGTPPAEVPSRFPAA